MKVLLEIKDKDVGLKEHDHFPKHFLVRRAARAVLLDGKGNVYFMHLVKRGIYKIPGGGLEKGEGILDGLKREVMEEAGVDFKILRELGIVIEERFYENDETGLFQITYSYLAEVKKGADEQFFTDDEKSEGAEGIWVKKDKALNIVKDYPFPDYESHFIKKREIRILEEAEKYW